MANSTGAGIIPEKVINYKLYVDGSNSEVALVDVEMPDIQFMSETISGAGIAGEIDSITMGHLQAMTMGINVRSLVDENFKLLEQKAYSLELKAAMQSADQSNGKLNTGRLRIMVNGYPKGLNLGTMGVGKATDSKQDFTVNYLKIESEGTEVLEIDKTNMIFKVNGTDYLTEVRSAMGL